MVAGRIRAVGPPTLAALPALPAQIGGEEARDLAERELSKPIYHQDDPSLVDRAVNWLLEQLMRAGARTVELAPAGVYGLLAIAVLIIVVIVVIRLRVGPMARRYAAPSAELGGQPLTAEEHRREAERAAATGRWADAVRERLRAVARALEVRVVIDPRPGRTADELAVEAGGALPDHADELRVAAGIFDDVWYGNRTATRESYERITRLDQNLRTAKPVTAEPDPVADAQPYEPAVVGGPPAGNGHTADGSAGDRP